MINRIIVVICILFFASSCSEKTISVYVVEPLGQHSEVRGENLLAFFEHNSRRKVTIHKVNSDDMVTEELDNIKVELLKAPVYDPLITKMGIYYFAFITEGDTLYANSTLDSWFYKNKVGKIETEESFKSRFLTFLK